MDSSQILENKHLLSNKKVLIVDDNAMNRFVIEEIMIQFKVCSHSLESGGDLILYFKNHHSDYDLILLDCHMPIIDGYEASRMIRSFEEKKGLSPIPIIAVTAHAIGDEEAKCAFFGMNGLVTKPIDENYLRNKMIEVLKIKGHKQV